MVGWIFASVGMASPSVPGHAPVGAICDARPERCGAVEGVVTGLPSGLGIPSVSVTLRALPPGPGPTDAASWFRVSTTDGEGAFEFSGLPAGLYALEAEGLGWSAARVSPVVVVGGRVISEHLEMTALPRPEVRAPRT